MKYDISFWMGPLKVYAICQIVWKGLYPDNGIRIPKRWNDVLLNRY